MFALTINLVASNTIPANSTFTITVYGLVNPLSPNLYNFKATTYYDSLVTSLVETNAFAFSASFTAITNPLIDLQPNSCAVYNLTAMTISFTNPLEIPSNSVFKIEFPSEISHI